MRIRRGLYCHSPLVLVIVCSLPETGRVLTVGAKRFRCAEVLFQSEACELLDGNIFTVDTKRFRHVELLFQLRFRPAEYTSCGHWYLCVHIFLPTGFMLSIR